MASLKKRAKKSASKKQAPVTHSPVLGNSVDQDLESWGMDINRLKGVMDISVNIFQPTPGN